MRAVNLGRAQKNADQTAHQGHTANVMPGSGFTVRDVVEIDGITRKKVAFSVRYENNVLFYRFASELTSFRLTRNKLWHNPRSFPRRATASDGTRSNGTVPVKQNLIQGRRRSFTVPVATAASRECARLSAVFCGRGAFRSSDH
ncbi:hypothetical protein [Paraburkholderia youngii]|uniref:hypothetical protein n=1 Tax=Paraburkholderia youngii TaxID=2782701 RepID=UPI001C3DAB33|nr:hypothetical protein [Paraburkholderia youngii]